MNVRRTTRERCRGRMKAVVVISGTELLLVKKLGIPLAEYAKHKRPVYFTPKFGEYRYR